MTGKAGIERIALLQMLAERLERLNVDSKWARRASGTRGSVTKTISLFNEGKDVPQGIVDNLIHKSMEILAKAAREIPEQDEKNTN